jgi:2-methylcitrate dehydratase PrpD
MKNGRIIERYVPIPRGFPGNRANEEELEEKHRSLMEPVLGKTAVDEILTLVRESSDVAPVTRLTKALALP